MVNPLEVYFAERLFSIMGDPTILGVFVLGLFMLWMKVSNMDRVGILLVSMLLILTLTKIGLLPFGVWGITAIAAGLVVIASFFRGIGEI